MRLSFRPMKNQCVVVMRGDKVAGTVRRYGAHKRWVANVPGVLSAAANPGVASLGYLAEAKAALLSADGA